MLNQVFKPDFLKRLFIPSMPRPTIPVAPGLHHAMYQIDGHFMRFHLRVDRDGSGMLLANASAAARLSPAGTLIAHHLLEGADDITILRALEAHFSSTTQDTMLNDINRMRELMDSLANPSSQHPVINFEDGVASVYETQLIAPLQASVPLADPTRLEAILKRLWDIAVPHVTILVPPRPDAAALVQAIEHAEDLGMIAGVRGQGSDLHEMTLLRDLALAGVDYISLPYASPDEELHDSLFGAGDYAATERTFMTAHEYEVCPVGQIPLVEATTETLERTLDRLAALDVVNVALFAVAAPDDMPAEQRGSALAASELVQLGSQIDENSYQLRLHYLWQAPVLRNPEIALETQVQQGPRCVGDVSILVEPDGSVIPARGPYRSVGNLLHDPWEQIWRDQAFRIYRERVQPPAQFERYTELASYTETHLSPPTSSETGDSTA